MHVRAREDREADHVSIFLQGRAHDLLGRLAQAGIDDLHASIAKSAGYHLGTAVMAIEARLGDKNADFRLSHRGSI